MSGTGTGVLGVFLLVWVPSMDLYEHSGALEGAPRGYSSGWPFRKTVRRKGVW